MSVPRETPLSVDAYSCRRALETGGVGARVQLNAVGRAYGLHKRSSQSGRIVGWGRKPWCVRVRRDGLKRRETYNAMFWELERSNG